MKLHVSLFVLLVGFALSSCSHPHLYHATAEIKMLSRELTTISLAPGTHAGPDDAEFQNEFEVIFAPDLLEPVIRDLNLDHIWARRLNTGKDVLSMDEALKHLQQVLKLEVVPSSSNEAFILIKITASSEVPREAADIANAIADHYKAARDDAEEKLSMQGVAVLRDQIMMQEQGVEENQAKAMQNPQNADLQKQSQVSQNILKALRMKLQQDEEDLKLHESPVIILSRAVPPSP